MRKLTTRLFAAVTLCALITFGGFVRADIELIKGTGWTVSKLHDTKVTSEGPYDEYWTRSIDGGDFDRISFYSGPPLIPTGRVQGINGYSDDGGIIPGTVAYRTKFDITKIIDDPTAEVAHIGFWVFNTFDVDQILVNGQEVSFKILEGAGDKEGWFELQLDVDLADFELDVAKSFELDFIYDFSEANGVNGLLFGVFFDPELSEITSTTPEPATMLILGLGLAGLGLARRRK